jgi:hypothetical protein
MFGQCWLRTALISLACLVAGLDVNAQQTTEFYQLSELTMDPNAQPTVIGARKVDPSLYAASFFPKNLQCTSSLVGPRVLLTAAHCVTPGAMISLKVKQTAYSAVCDQAPGYHPKTNRSPDYALCLVATEINETPYFETVSIEPSRLKVGQQILLTGFGCTKAGGGGDTSGTVYRVGESVINTLPTSTDDRIVTKGQAAVCFGDSGGPGFLQRKGDDGGPRIQVSVNAVGNIKDVSGLASLSTPAAVGFLRDWSSKKAVSICGVHATATKCKQGP